MFDVAGKVVIVTGSSRGIGRAIVERLARAGAKIVVSSRKSDACDQVVSAIRKDGGAAISVPCHVGNRDQVNALVAATVAEWGTVDTLVCNAATNPSLGPLATLTDEEFVKVMTVNVQSSIWLTSLVAPLMKTAGGGSMILMSSIAALRGNAVIGAYGMSKAAEAAMARNLAVEHGPANIRVNAIAPGLVKTDFARALWEDPVYMKKQLNDTPLRRIGQPEDIAGIAHFLASDAAAYMTGQVIVADGGECIA